jgi:hypothetical protein
MHAVAEGQLLQVGWWHAATRVWEVARR